MSDTNSKPRTKRPASMSILPTYPDPEKSRLVVEEVSHGGGNKRSKSDDLIAELLLKVKHNRGNVEGSCSLHSMDRVFDIVVNHRNIGLPVLELELDQWKSVIIFFIRNGFPASKLERVLHAYKAQPVGGREAGKVIESTWVYRTTLECDVLLVLVKHLPEELFMTVTDRITTGDNWIVADMVVDMCSNRTDRNLYKVTEILDALDKTYQYSYGINQPLIPQLDWVYWIGRMLNNNIVTHQMMLHLASLFTKHSANIGARSAILRNFTMKGMFLILLPNLKQVCFQPKRRLRDGQTDYSGNHVDLLFSTMLEHGKPLLSLQVLQLRIRTPQQESLITTGVASIKKVFQVVPMLSELKMCWVHQAGDHSSLRNSAVMKMFRDNVNVIGESKLEHLESLQFDLPFMGPDDETDKETDKVDATNTICTLYSMERLRKIHVTLPPQQVTLTEQLKEAMHGNVSLKCVEFLDHSSPLLTRRANQPIPKAKPSQDVYATMAKQYAKLTLCGRYSLTKDQASSSDFLRVVERLKTECSTLEETVSLLYMITGEFVSLFVKSTVH